eukprot:2151979-Lingulodinium_polyedra.AAC.1
METAGMVAAASGASDASMLFTDFGAAFPSLCQAWLWFVLRKMGVPSIVVDAWVALYAGSKLQVVLGASRYGWVWLLRGIRQGCPAAMCLFAYAMDPLVTFLRVMVALPSELVAGYADDL